MGPRSRAKCGPDRGRGDTGPPNLEIW